MVRTMSLLGLAVISTLSSSLLMGCQTSQVQPERAVTLKAPPKDIVIFEGDTSRPYVVLGDVEYTHDQGVAFGFTLEPTMEAQKLVKDGLRSVAFTKYGDKVDAIIHVKMGKDVAGGFFGAVGSGFGAKNTMVSGQGLAVSYKGVDETKGPAQKVTQPPSPSPTPPSPQRPAEPPAATPSAPTPPSAPSRQEPAPAQKNEPALTLVITVPHANLRDGGDPKAKVVRVLPKNTRLTVLGKANQWYMVRLDDGTEGWVAESVTLPGR